MIIEAYKMKASKSINLGDKKLKSQEACRSKFNQGVKTGRLNTNSKRSKIKLGTSAS